MILWSNILVPAASMIITVFATVYTVSERVKNENREKHKPYLTLNNIEPLEKIDEYKYYLTLFGRNYKKEILEKTEEEKKKKKENEYLSVRLLLDNIGYGVASNIKFYNLLTGEEIKGTQTPSKDKNQKLLTTFDIGTNIEKQLQVKIYNKLKKEDEIEKPDHCRILCVYQDLNGNAYDFIISINIKSNKSYDFFTYQRTSHSYERWISETKKQYKQIIREYKK